MAPSKIRFLLSSVLLAVCIAPAAAQEEPVNRNRSPAPISSAASVALLANRLDASAIERLGVAITHDVPVVRAVAARVAGVNQVRSLAAGLAAALEREPDEAAAAEQVRALLFMDLPESRAAVEAHLPRARRPAILAYMEWLVIARPENVPERMERAFKLDGLKNPAGLSGLVARAILRNPDGRERLLRAWLQVASPGGWDGVLGALTDMPDSDVPVLDQALDSSDPAMRERTVWAIVLRLARGRPVATGALEAALPRQPENPSSAEPAPPVSWEWFGRELVARRHRGAQTPDRSLLIRTEADTHKAEARMLPLFKELTRAERSALKETIGAEQLVTTPPRDVKQVRGQGPMRTTAIPWPGVLAELLRLSRCPVSDSPRMGAVELTYRPDGRPVPVSIDLASLPAECEPALAAVARMTLPNANLEVVEGEKQFVILPIHEDFVACTAESVPPPRVETLQTRGARIEAPKKIRDVRPVYPQGAQQAGVQGIVVLDAIVSIAGCTTSISVLVSVHPALDFAAVRAVSGWRFTPTLLDGQPVPVAMTVTVTFNLR